MAQETPLMALPDSSIMSDKQGLLITGIDHTTNQAEDGASVNSNSAAIAPPDQTSRSSFSPQTIGLSNMIDRPRGITVAVDPVALVTTECITVTSAMRKHARWAHSSVSAILGGGGSSSNFGSNSVSSRHTIVNGPSGDARSHKTSRNLHNESTISTGRSISASASMTSIPESIKTTSNATSRLLEPSSATSARGSRLRANTLDDEDNLVSQWGRRSKKGKSMQDHPLMSAFARLRSNLRGCRDIYSFDTAALLHPFLQVIRSSSTSAAITSLAIVAITKFFDYRIIRIDSPQLGLAMQLLSAAITHCRFEASESSADEIVLLQILRLMESMISGPGGIVLGDDSICEMMETGLSMCCQKRLSDLVRRSAEMSMIKMCQVIFEHLNDLDLNSESTMEATPRPKNEERTPIVLSRSMDSHRSSIDHQTTATGTKPASDEPSRSSTAGRGDLPSLNVDTTNVTESEQRMRASLDASLDIQPYSLPSIRELFRVLVDLLKPQHKEHNDTLRVMALRIIDVALEVAGPSIAKHPSLASLARDDLCRYLFQLVRTDSAQLLNESLRVSGTLLATCRGVLKLQQELFLSYLVECLHPRVEIPQESGINPVLYEGVPKTPKFVQTVPSNSPGGRSTPVPVKERHQLGMDGTSRRPDAREAMIESIGALCRIPSYLVELFINYDCELDRNDLCEDLIGLLCRNAFPDSATWSTTSVPPLSLDSLLTFVQSVADRLDIEPDEHDTELIQRLREQRARKGVIITGIMQFNEDPRDGLNFLAANKIIDSPSNPDSVAKFLKSTTRISKRKLGEFISKRDQEPLLQAFMALFDFTDERVDEALRDLLYTFRLPGESQLIERIVTVFSQRYCSNTKPEHIANEDAVFTLTYSIIMLNTDQHNPNIKKEKRMTAADFAKNLRGVNGGHDFAPDYLAEIYENIKSNEIILPDEHDNERAFHYTWEGLLVKAQNAGLVRMCSTNAFDADMFRTTWHPIVATLSYVFMSASDEAVFSRVVLGFDQCACIAAKYGLSDALDRIIFCLSSITELAPQVLPNTRLNTEVQVKESFVMVSETAVKFGRNHKAQLACAVLFRLIEGKEHIIRRGWRDITRIWLNLFANSLLSPALTCSQEHLKLPPILQQPRSQKSNRDQRASDSGLFSSFTSYLTSYAADDPPEPSEEEVESTMISMECLATCPMDDIFSNLLSSPPETRTTLISILLQHFPEPSSPMVLVARPDQPRPVPIRVNGSQPSVGDEAYDSSMVFLMELVTILTGRDRQSLESMGKSVADVLQSIIRDWANVHNLTLSRALSYLFHLLNNSQQIEDQAIVKTPVLLHLIAGFDNLSLQSVAGAVLHGLEQCLQAERPLRREIINTPDFWAILHGLYSTSETASSTFRLVEEVVESRNCGVMADNYNAAVNLLNEIATAACSAVSHDSTPEDHARQGHKSHRGRGKRQPGPAQVMPPRSPQKEVISQGQRAIILLARLTDQLPEFIHKSKLSRPEAWKAYWPPVLFALQAQCLNPCRQVRRQACSALQGICLSSNLTLSADDEWKFIFDTILLDLVTRLLKPEVFQTDPTGMPETRLQIAQLLCRTFLHHLISFAKLPIFSETWFRILEVMDRLINSSQGDNLEEAIPEILKNILLVMADGGTLVPPDHNQDADSSLENTKSESLWQETQKRCERLSPGLFNDLFPSPSPRPKPNANADPEVKVEREPHSELGPGLDPGPEPGPGPNPTAGSRPESELPGNLDDRDLNVPTVTPSDTVHDEEKQENKSV